MPTRVLKILGIADLVVIAIALLLIAFIWGSFKWDRYTKNKEAIRYQKKVCDIIKTVAGNFEIMVDGFTPKELKTIKFYLTGQTNYQRYHHQFYGCK
ncbi:MAG: hypothetical protein EOO96_23040 [Pedobacter sp.]|nr:MAG: hypothetical protein EOO96_23040 [Pedobacter sp.]